MSRHWIAAALAFLVLSPARMSGAQPSEPGGLSCHDTKVERGVVIECEGGFCQFLPDRKGVGRVCATLKLSLMGEASDEIIEACAELDSGKPELSYNPSSRLDRCRHLQIDKVTFDESLAVYWAIRLGPVLLFLVPLLSALFVAFDTRRRLLARRNIWVLGVLFASPIALPWYLVKRPPKK